MYADNTQPTDAEQPVPQVEQPASESEQEVVSTEAPESIAPADLQQHTERQWPALIIYSVLAIAVAILVVFGGRWVYHKVHNSNKPTPAPAGNNSPAAPSDNQPTNQNTQNTPNNPNSNASSQPSSTSQPAQNTALPNTGPGDVVAIFAAVTIAAAGLHYIYVLRKQN